MIPHAGNQCPVFPDVLVRVVLNGDEPGLARIGRADEFNWRTVDFADPEVHENRIVSWEEVSEKIQITTASSLLRAADDHMVKRASVYDQEGGERSMGATVQAFNAITGRDLRESEGWMLLELLKLVRSEQRRDPHMDSIEDAVAYSALYGEARAGGR